MGLTGLGIEGWVEGGEGLEKCDGMPEMVEVDLVQDFFFPGN